MPKDPVSLHPFIFSSKEARLLKESGPVSQWTLTPGQQQRLQITWLCFSECLLCSPCCAKNSPTTCTPCK